MMSAAPSADEKSPDERIRETAWSLAKISALSEHMSHEAAKEKHRPGWKEFLENRATDLLAVFAVIVRLSIPLFIRDNAEELVSALSTAADIALVALLLWAVWKHFLKRHFEGTPVRAARGGIVLPQEEYRYIHPTSADVKELKKIYQYDLDKFDEKNVTSMETLKAIAGSGENNICILTRCGRMVGFYIYALLDRSAALGITKGKYPGINFVPEKNFRGPEECSAIYVSDVVVTDDLIGKGSLSMQYLLADLIENIDRTMAKTQNRPSILFGRPVTREGRELAKRYGMEKINASRAGELEPIYHVSLKHYPDDLELDLGKRLSEEEEKIYRSLKRKLRRQKPCP